MGATPISDGAVRLGIIYALEDPRTNEVRYVGQTTQSLHARLGNHSSARFGKSHRTRWVRKLAKAGARPNIFQLDEAPLDQLDAAEIAWIAAFRSMGLRLTNGTDGGDGAPTPEVLARRSAGIRKSWLHRDHAEHGRKISATKSKPECRASVSGTMKAIYAARVHHTKNPGPELRAKLSERSKATWADPKHRQKTMENRAIFLVARHTEWTLAAMVGEA